MFRLFCSTQTGDDWPARWSSNITEKKSWDSSKDWFVSTPNSDTKPEFFAKSVKIFFTFGNTNFKLTYFFRNLLQDRRHKLHFVQSE